MVLVGLRGFWVVSFFCGVGCFFFVSVVLVNLGGQRRGGGWEDFGWV